MKTITRNPYAGQYAPVGALVYSAYWHTWTEVVSHNENGSVTVKGLTGDRAGETWSHLTSTDGRDIVLTGEWEKNRAPGGGVEYLVDGRLGIILDVDPRPGFDKAAILLSTPTSVTDDQFCAVLVVDRADLDPINANDVPDHVRDAYPHYMAGCVLCRHFNHSWLVKCWV